MVFTDRFTIEHEINYSQYQIYKSVQAFLARAENKHIAIQFTGQS